MALVQLYRYDLSNGLASQWGQALLGRQVTAIWHTAIVVFGREYYFDGGVGIVSHPIPGGTRFGRPMVIDRIGVTLRSQGDFQQWIAQRSRDRYGPADYNLLLRNCNHFSDEAAVFLTGEHISRDVRGMIEDLLSTPMGSLIRPMLESFTHSGNLTAAPNSASTPSEHLVPLSAPSAGTAIHGSGLASGHATVTPASDFAREADDDDISLIVAVAVSEVEHDPAKLAALRTSMETICAAFERILGAPTDPTVRSLNCRSGAFATKILGGSSVSDGFAWGVFRAAGFEKDDAAQRLVLPSTASLAVLQAVCNELSQARVSLRQTDRLLLSSENCDEDAGATATETTRRPHTFVVWASAAALMLPSPAHRAVEFGREGDNALWCVVANRDEACHAGKGRWDTTRSVLPPAPAAQRQHVDVEFLVTELQSVDGTGRPRHAVRATQVAGEEALKELLVLAVPTTIPVERLVWVPLWLLQVHSAARSDPQPWDRMDAVQHRPRLAVSTAQASFTVASVVARAKLGSTTHPAFLFAATGENAATENTTAVVPYGGHPVSDDDRFVEILCDREWMGNDLQQAYLAWREECGTPCTEKQRHYCEPISTIDDLLSWATPQCNGKKTVRVERASPWNPRDAEEAADRPRSRVLVCHDYKGGYVRGDRAIFSSASSSSVATRDVYTVENWDLVDIFVYFSHALVTVPPFDWIESAHHHGVPILGTFLTEWERGKRIWNDLLTDPNRMATAIKRLTDVAVWFGFDGYLLNVENEVAATHVKRVAAFVQLLRKSLKAAIGCHALVVWYDAVTAEGRLSFQNTLNDKNRVFFDASDAIFLNYFWKPPALQCAAETAGPLRRRDDVYVGVDCFGRGTFGGGGFSTHVAVGEALCRGLSIALFAPGWTLENASDGTRLSFLAADARFWKPLRSLIVGNNASGHRSTRSLAATSASVSMYFSRGTGERFAWCGEIISTGSWVQRASQDSNSTFVLSNSGRDICASIVSGTDGRAAFVGDDFLAVQLSESDMEHNSAQLLFSCVPTDGNLPHGECDVRIAWRSSPCSNADPSTLTLHARVIPHPGSHSVNDYPETVFSPLTNTCRDSSGWNLATVTLPIPPAAFPVVEVSLRATNATVVDIGLVSVATPGRSSASVPARPHHVACLWSSSSRWINVELGFPTRAQSRWVFLVIRWMLSIPDTFAGMHRIPVQNTDGGDETAPVCGDDSPEVERCVTVDALVRCDFPAEYRGCRNLIASIHALDPCTLQRSEIWRAPEH